MAEQTGLPGRTDGRQDAFRHAYWNALNAQEYGMEDAAYFPTLHEFGPNMKPDDPESPNSANNPNSSGYNPVSVQMDLYNNEVGRHIGADHPGVDEDQLADYVLDALNKGRLKVVKMKTVQNGTLTPDEVPVNASGAPIKSSREKILIDSAPIKDNSDPLPQGDYGATPKSHYDGHEPIVH